MRRQSDRDLPNERITRRAAIRRVTEATLATSFLAHKLPAAESDTFRLRYVLGSSMYGKLKLAEILPEVRKTGAEHIDIWPLVHADQREQIEAMGHERFMALLAEHDVKFGMSTCYNLGPFNLADEIAVVVKFGGRLVISGSRGPRDATGAALKAAVRDFIEKLKPQINAAERHGITIGIENHANALIHTPDSLRYLAELSPSDHLGIALAPYHLPQDPQLIASLIDDLGERLVHFYAWQHGHGAMQKLPKEQELMQMPGRGPLDFVPIVAALKKIKYARWTEIFMHPVPRGIPILETATLVTAEINRSRAYLRDCVQQA